jgi:hypothetical protein
VTDPLAARFGAAPERAVDPAVLQFARELGEDAGACAVLFYGSNLRTGSLDGVLDFYVLLPGSPERGLWPRVSYRERLHGDVMLRAKVAAMTLATFARAARGETRDTTIWSRFVQPSALAWSRDEASEVEVRAALADAARTAARLAVALGPTRGREEDFWRALFRATYRAELRVEPAGREDSILAANRSHFDGLLPLALVADAIPFAQHGQTIEPRLSDDRRKMIRRWWRSRRRLGKALNLARLAKAMTTFEGGMRYAAWKVERHTGKPVKVTPLRERFPLIAAPAVMWLLWKSRGRARPAE